MHFTAISHRGEPKGAFFDHFTVRTMTGWPTKSVLSPDVDTSALASYINLREGFNDYGLPIHGGVPDIATNQAEDAACLFIPGYTRESDNKNTLSHNRRLIHEKELIQKAMLRGQPVLAVCAGSWTLWQAYGGTLVDVIDHNYGGAMPRLSKQEPAVCNNKMIHRIRPEKGTLLADTMLSPQGKTDNIPVNSVHWKAVDESCKPINLRVNAYSIQDDELAPQSRQSHLMQPENSVEGFETIHGVPMIGVQWHPEAFNLNETNIKAHQGLFKTIQSAGMTYLNRRKLNIEFKDQVKKNTNNSASFFQPQVVIALAAPVIKSEPQPIA